MHLMETCPQKTISKSTIEVQKATNGISLKLAIKTVGTGQVKPLQCLAF